MEASTRPLTKAMAAAAGGGLTPLASLSDRDLDAQPATLERPESAAAMVLEDCGQCPMCLDKPKFGGPGNKKKACIAKRTVAAARPAPTLVPGSIKPPNLDTPPAAALRGSKPSSIGGGGGESAAGSSQASMPGSLPSGGGFPSLSSAGAPTSS